MEHDINGPYYKVKRVGGYSPCILGNAKNRYAAGSVLPNCVGYAWGAFHERSGWNGFPFWTKGNAGDLLEAAKAEGLVTSMDPTPGGIMIWTDGGAGHAAFVEEVGAGWVLTTESGWNFAGYPVRKYTRRGADWRDGCYWMSTEYKYAGCINHPSAPTVGPVEYLDFWTHERREIPGIYDAGRNYIQLSAAGDLGLLKAGWNAKAGLPEIGPTKR